MKGDWDGFNNIGSGSDESGNDSAFINGKDYNSAGSSSVGRVDSVQTISNAHSKPDSSTPNSVTKSYKNGKLDSERYFGSDGKPYLDIDYSDHGNAKTHPDVPHQHTITFENGKMKRDKTDGRIK